MPEEQSQTLEAILDEIKIITVELQLLRRELRREPLPYEIDEIDGAELSAESVELTDETPADPVEEGALAVDVWLAARGIMIKNAREQSAADMVFDQLADFLGSRFDNLTRVHSDIRRTLPSGRSFTLNLSSSRQEEIADVTQFCSVLSTYAFLTSYNYNKSTKTIFAIPQRDGKVINFFNGGWFERYVYQRTVALLVQNMTDFTCLMNPQITFPNGDDFELDLIFLIDGQPLWVECKTGEYAAYVAKYAEMRKLLSVSKSRSILVILGVPDDVTANLSHIYDITVANENNFLQKIDIAIGLPEQSSTQNANGALTPVGLPMPIGVPSSLSTLLNKADLRPLPEIRRLAIDALIPLISALDQPRPIMEFKPILADALQTSKSKSQNILNAIARGGCLLDDDGQTVWSLTVPFFRLISEDPAVIDSKCIESYAHIVLAMDPDYFDGVQARSKFEVVVGGKAPDMATLNGLSTRIVDDSNNI